MEASQIQAVENLDPNAPLHKRILVKYRKYIAILIPLSFYHLVWWCLAIRNNYFPLFNTHYIMSITMIFGSMVAGATSEGGGAVAFPVMTLALKIKPAIARDFSLMTQSCGKISLYQFFAFATIVAFWTNIMLNRGLKRYTNIVL